MTLKKYTRPATECHICTRWTPISGCDHYKPANEELVKEIIAAIHNGNEEIVETKDFTDGVKYALLVLQQNKAFRRG